MISYTGCRQCLRGGVERRSKMRIQTHRHGHGLRKRTRHREGPERMDFVRESDQGGTVRRHQGKIERGAR